MEELHMDGKNCTKCGEWKLFTEYTIDRRRKSDPYSSWCKKCVATNGRKWYENNKAHQNAKTAKWRLDNHDAALEIERRSAEKHKVKRRIAALARYYANQEAAKARSRLYRLLFPEKHKAAVDRWRANNSEYVAEWRRQYGRAHTAEQVFYHARRRAFKKSTFADLTVVEWKWLISVSGENCLCCGQKRKLTQDHIVPLNPGLHSLFNIQPLCQSCNASKGRKTIDYRPDWLKKLVEDYINGNSGRGIQLRSEAQQEYQAAQAQV